MEYSLEVKIKAVKRVIEDKLCIDKNSPCGIIIMKTKVRFKSRKEARSFDLAFLLFICYNILWLSRGMILLLEEW